jgi:hypothetical protein
MVYWETRSMATMKIFIELELRGDDVRQYAKMYRYISNEVAKGLGDAIFSIPNSAWVAEITGFDLKYKFKREFLRFKKDYSRSNSVGSRGVYANYILESGHIYDIKDHKDRYFCKVDSHGNIIRLSESDVKQCLKNI